VIATLRHAVVATALLLMALPALLPAALAQNPVPALTSPVTDLTGTLDAEQRTALEERIKAFESRKGSQIAVLLVPTTEPETIEQFSFRVVEQWKIGRKGVDDGALLIVAVKDRALRIEVGYGLEGVMPDAVAKRIVSDEIVPHLKRGDFYGGINAGVSRMMSVVEGEALPAPRGAQRGAAADGGNLEGLLIVGFILVFIVGGLVRALFGKFLGSAVIGGLGGAAGWLMLGSLGIALGIGVVAAFLSLMGGMGGSGRRGGWYSGGGAFGGGRGGWGGGGGGSWGGGGGGFGGGGASGRW
jgi:uncharacterized protein